MYFILPYISSYRMNLHSYLFPNIFFKQKNKITFFYEFHFKMIVSSDKIFIRTYFLPIFSSSKIKIEFPHKFYTCQFFEMVYFTPRNNSILVSRVHNEQKKLHIYIYILRSINESNFLTASFGSGSWRRRRRMSSRRTDVTPFLSPLRRVSG